ncbi:endoribonuclease L-PSP [Bacillus sp. FJAT-18017]|uniref:RidA family protein n=1 Tax=Bacillus sp. FJAT-18017 TaxID=1705566 RepID=UPI0006B06582|nr:Rid family detoxifying hydrolase [Bacillus sp. FJAT-18017]ALC92221.1 endoribonuclease L-PSP [Bacillus sp. FJAT-18017]
MSRRVFEAKGAKSVGPYSHAVEAGELVFLSGQTPVNAETGELVKGGIKEQTAQCFRNLFAVLEASGLTPDDVMKVNVFLTDMRNFTEMNEVYAAHFSEPFPARTTVAVLGLPLGAEVEIEMVAKRP